MKTPPQPFINRVSLQGVISNHPSTKALTSTTMLTSFQLSVIESWRNAEQEYRERKNQITVEVVGRDSAYVAKAAKLGSWVTLEGYIRSEQSKGQDLVKVRTFTVTVWEGPDGMERAQASSDEREPGGAAT